MDDDQRLHRFRNLLALVLGELHFPARAATALERMEHAQPVDFALRLGWQAFVASVHVHELRIAAFAGQRHRRQDRRPRGRREIRVIGVKLLTPHQPCAAGFVGVLARDKADQRMVGQRETFDLLGHDFTEYLRGLEEFGGRELLIAEDKDRPIGESLSQVFGGTGIQRFTEVDAEHFRTRVVRHGTQGQIHRGASI